MQCAVEKVSSEWEGTAFEGPHNVAEQQGVCVCVSMHKFVMEKNQNRKCLKMKVEVLAMARLHCKSA